MARRRFDGSLLSFSSDSRHIQQRKGAISSSWARLQKLTEARTKALAAAKEIHAFNRDASDTMQSVQVCSESVV